MAFATGENHSICLLICDAAGNITSNDVLDFVWDAAGRLKEAKTAGTSTVVGAYVYDYANKRTSKIVSGTTTHYVYGQGGLLYGEYDNTGALIREYVYLNGEPLAQIDAGSPEVLIYLHTDHLMTPRYATNTGGSTVWTWDSGAFGAEAPTGSASVNLRFPGQYYDAETNLHYNWNRYYDPATGRYISSDPIGLAGGLNTFGYVGQNPINSSDPTGLMGPLAPAATKAAVKALQEAIRACLSNNLCSAATLGALIQIQKSIMDTMTAIANCCGESSSEEKWHTFYHGTAQTSAESIKNDGLNPDHGVQRLYMDGTLGPPGFYMSDSIEIAHIFMHTRMSDGSSGAILKFEICDTALEILESKGAKIKALSVGFLGNTYFGNELFIPLNVYPTFMSLVLEGKIIVSGAM